ncbi:hypothetical protein GCM10009788_58140 [Nocardioides humi]|uniref:DUF3152 domain-containing protein n=1 Tax=Nocardioides humi TaxID=449461 RepID=A0ABN2BZB0_9ACTN
MSKRRATHRRAGSHRAPRRRATNGLTVLAVLAATVAVAAPIALLNPGAPDTGEAGRRTPVAASPSEPAPDPTLKGRRPDGEVAVGRDRDPVPKGPPSPATRIPERGPGTFEVAAAAPLGSQEGVTYRVEVERGLPFSTVDVARLVEATLADQRGWATRHTLVRVDGHADLRIVLATPQTADRLCAPLDTGGRLSCRNGGDVVLNAWRWQFGADGYAGDLQAYRRYVINHETGHALGYPHVGCPGSGRLAPVMLQQTKGLAGCRPNPWPSRVDLVAH